MSSTKMGQRAPERCVNLTEEEALALLDICMIAKCEDNPIRANAMTKLADVCREFLRDEALPMHPARQAATQNEPWIPGSARWRSNLHRALLRPAAMQAPDPCD